MHFNIKNSRSIGLIPNLSNLLIHIIGIGGIGMSAIAEILYKNGIPVQGSDINPNENTVRLEKLGVKCFIGHNPENIKNATIVAYSTAVKDTNIEYQASLEAKKIMMSRDQILKEIIQNSWNICVSGMHGKTTTSSIISLIFEHTGLKNFISIVGGLMQYNQSNTISYKNHHWSVVEADESDDSFIKIPASIAVITNISPEHLDYHLTFEAIKHKFKEFLTRLPWYGFGVVCIDDQEVKKIADEVNNTKIITYSTKDKEANYYATNIKMEILSSDQDSKSSIKFDVLRDGIFLENFAINIFGNFNISNCLAAIAVANELQIDLQIIKKALFDFRSTKRRFEILGSYSGATVIDDYGHHPREIDAVLKTANDLKNFHQSKLTVIFQPHRYSRLQKLFNEFINVFQENKINNLIFLPVYNAGEKEINGVSSQALKNALEENEIFDGKIFNCENNIDDFKKLIDQNELNKNDIVLFLGAGDLNELAKKLIY